METLTRRAPIAIVGELSRPRNRLRRQTGTHAFTNVRIRD